MEDNDKEQSRKGQKVSKTTKISIKKNDGGDLFPLKNGQTNEQLDITLEDRREGRLIIVKIKEHPSPPSGSGPVVIVRMGNSNLGELTCRKDGLVISGVGIRRIYDEKMRYGGNRGWKKNDDGSIGLEMSLGECKTLAKEKIECSLKGHK